MGKLDHSGGCFDRKNLQQLSGRTMRRSSDFRKYVFCNPFAAASAIRFVNWRINRIYSADSGIWGIYRLRCGDLFNADGKPCRRPDFYRAFFVLQQIKGNLIYPHVVGNSVGLPSIWVLVAVTIGGSAMGVLGMLVFIPLCSVLYSLLRALVNHRVENKCRKD